MNLIPRAVDTETFLIQTGNLTPPVVCLSTAERQANAITTTLELKHQGIASFRRLIRESFVIAHNAPFDGAVLSGDSPELIFDIFDAYEKGTICNTITLQKLIDVALGERDFRRRGSRVTKTTYALEDLVELYYGEKIQKEDTWRLSYGLLADISIERWPPSARTYAIFDAYHALRVWEAQQRLIREKWGELPNQLEQQRAAWVLYLMSTWGIRAEKERVDYFVSHCEEEIRKMHVRLLYCLHCGRPRSEHQFGNSCRMPVCVLTDGFENSGLFKDDGSRTMSEIRRRVVEACQRQNVQVPYTDPSPKFPQGQVVTDKDTLLETDDPLLHVLAEQMTFAKHLGQWGPVLRAAEKRPVCCRYEELRETGRTASSGSEGQEGTNIQNPPRKGDVRPAIVPRPGYVYCSTDADTIELRSHAQNCLELVGWSRMAERLVLQAKSKGPDLHEVLGAAIVGIDPLEFQARRKAGDVDMNDARQFAKIPNFGFPGGLGAETFVAYAAAQLSREAFAKWFSNDRERAVMKAKHLRLVWFDTFPENRLYFEKVGRMIDRNKGYGTIQQLMSRRYRGHVRFTAAANGFFQGRVADAMKDILWRLAQECYTGRETRPDGRISGNLSVLFGSRPVMFLHDEPILEHPEVTAHERAERQRTIVVETLSRWLPDIPCTSSAVLMRRWHKGAEPLYVNGKLVPVKPMKSDTGKVLWVADYPGEIVMAA